jgi:hypothetical protein
VVRPADDTFDTKKEAEVWLTRKEAEILEDDWIDPDAGEILLADYGATWIDERPGLRPKTVTLYRYLLRAIMYTAVEDGLIRRNPCRIKGAGSEDSPERPVLTASARLRLSSSPARTASRSGIATSTAVSGCLPLLLSAWPVFIFTTCGILATSSSPTRARTLGS